MEHLEMLINRTLRTYMPLFIFRLSDSGLTDMIDLFIYLFIYYTVVYALSVIQ